MSSNSDRGHALQIRFERALERKAGGRKRRLRIARVAARPRSPASAATASARAAAIATPVSAMTQLETLEACVIAHAVGEQAVALLHGALEVADARAIAGDRSRE